MRKPIRPIKPKLPKEQPIIRGKFKNLESVEKFDIFPLLLVIVPLVSFLVLRVELLFVPVSFYELLIDS